MNRFKKGPTKKKWQEDIQEAQDLVDILKEYKPANEPQSDQLNEENSNIKKQIQKNETQAQIPQKQTKKKQFEWMSDSDQQLPKQKDNKKNSKDLVQQQIDQQGYIDIFITHIPPKATQEDLSEYLSKFGKIKDLFMPLVQGTQIHKGKAFVQFIPNDPNFLQIKQHKLKGHVIEVSNKILFNQNKQEEPQKQIKRNKSRSRSRERNRNQRGQYQQKQQEQQQNQNEQMQWYEQQEQQGQEQEQQEENQKQQQQQQSQELSN